MKLSGWGRFPTRETPVVTPSDLDSLRAEAEDGSGLIARGNGRAYGDSAIGQAKTVSMRRFNRMLAFDAQTGILTAEAGVILGDVIAAFLPRGWFPLVTPGTKFVTLGGVIAADVHGKNHHKDGSFASCVEWVELLGPDGVIKRCSRTENPDLYGWTLGGMGLTGIILRAAIHLQPVQSAWIKQTMLPAPNLFTAMALFEATQDSTYSVAWIDCLGRGKNMGRSLVMLGEHAHEAELDRPRRRRPFHIPPKRKLSIPLDFPGWALNGLSVRAFNGLYYWNGSRKPRDSFVDWDSYFYPLDAILGWNRIYGRKGFMQFQCALPMASAYDGLEAILTETAKAGAGSFLAVLKRFGMQDSPISFPMEGYTLALDFPVNARTLKLMNRLDAVTLDHGGRFYLAKDSRMSAETLHRSDPRMAEFAAMRAEQELSEPLRSAQAERLAL